MKLNRIGGCLLALSGPLLAYELHARHVDEVVRLTDGADPFSALGMIAFLYAVGTMLIGAALALHD